VAGSERQLVTAEGEPDADGLPAGNRRPRDPLQRRSQAERRAATQRALIEAAIEILNERGFNAATAVAVAERAGVTRGAVQHHFGTTQALLVAVMRHVSRARDERAQPTPRAPAPLSGRVRALIQEYRLLYDGPDGVALMEIWLGAGHDEDLRQQVDALMQRITERRLDHWRSVLADVALSDAEIVTLRGVMVSTLRGAAIHRVLSRNPNQAAAQVDLFCAMTEAWLVRRGPAAG
jgi:AcrR family transcriptional regulator